MRRIIGLLGLLIAGFTLVMAFPRADAQGEDLCPALVTQALNEVGGNCGGMGRNNACYGFNRVDATFAQAQPEDFFNSPADRADVPVLSSLETAPLDADLSTWGVAVMNLQANLPDTLPGQAVVVLLMGDVAVENAAPDEEETTVEPIEVSVGGDINVRSGPSLNANVLGGVTTGQTLLADRRSADGEWLRVAFNDGPAWINRRVVLPAGDVETLPIYTDEQRGWMQAFYFRTGVGEPTCVGSPPPSLVVQGPQRVNVNLTVNGADITLGSTLHFMQTAPDVVRIAVIDGEAHLPGGIVLLPGYVIFAHINPETGGIEDEFYDMRPMTSEELAELEFLEGVPESVLNYPIVIPDGTQQSTGGGQPTTGGEQQTSNAAPPANDCGSFAGLSPFGGFANGLNDFSWNPAPSATAYRVNVYNDGGALVGSHVVEAPNTSLVADIGAPQYGTGTIFSWSVEALISETVICASGPFTVQRAGQPNVNGNPPVDLGGDTGDNTFQPPDIPPGDNDDGNDPNFNEGNELHENFDGGNGG